MKLTLGLVAALAGCAAAAQQAAEVYILPGASQSSTVPSVSRSLARLILLQRLAPAGKGPSTAEIPNGSDAENVVSLISKFGKEPVSLFGQGETLAPSQLVVMVEGLNDDQIKTLGRSFKSGPSFTIPDPPSAHANEKLISNDVYNVGVTNDHKCSIKKLSNPFDKNCWSGKSAVAKYNVQKDPSVVGDLSRLASHFARLATSGEMETTIVLFHASTANSNVNQWSEKFQELRRRQAAEEVVSVFEVDVEVDLPSSVGESDAKMTIFSSPSKVPTCFTSKEACLSGTNKCSGYGECLNRWAEPDGSDEQSGSDGKGRVCYACHCSKRREKSGGVTQMAGPTCSKQDVSVPFWLFAGFTLLMVGILTFAIGILFSVGEEKLPGVLGAGVSKSK
ncbi:unnamed protein product [Clonostachys rhizophaga]|uniref:Vacuolar sorting protein Vps3844 C-terminal domain-containing protein n=1 Tax=Clonostachys rhizophaga TaxID=160324 RepID=A0A9N9YSS7_9HYPO|nr:unnamed protein product [Clonostachys rhizophaga]